MLEEDKQAELERKGWPQVEGWLAEEEEGTLSKEEPFMMLGTGTMGPGFKVAQDKEKEFVNIQENEMVSVEGRVVQPGLHISDSYFKIYQGLLYCVKRKLGVDEESHQFFIPCPFRRIIINSFGDVFNERPGKVRGAIHKIVMPKGVIRERWQLAPHHLQAQVDKDKIGTGKDNVGTRGHCSITKSLVQPYGCRTLGRWVIENV